MEKQYRYNIKLTAREIGQIEGALQFLFESNFTPEAIRPSFNDLLKTINGQFEAQQLELKFGMEVSDDGPSS